MIKIFTKKIELQNRLLSIKESIGLVPTMGNLHKGHLNLLEESLRGNDISIISIFVNPTQFSETEDLSSYPRTFEQDCKLIEEIQNKYNKEVIIFHPKNKDEVYPSSYELLEVQRFERDLEGDVRPTHFKGVVSVVKFLFDITFATKAYFGKKDYQQLIVIQDLVKSLSLDIEIVPVEICREPSGLAMSSRNNYLSSEDKETALNLRRALLKVSKTLKKSGLQEATEQIKTIQNKDKSFNYLEIRNQQSFEPARPKDRKFVIVGNYQVQSTRLLDNIEVF